MHTRLAALLALFCGIWFAAPAASGQQPSPGGGNPGTSTNPGGTRSRPSLGGNDPGISTQRPIFVSGKVVLDDGTTPLEPIRIERVCGTSARAEAFTDRKGRFSFEIGRNQEFQDASESPFDSLAGGGGNPDYIRGGGGLSNRAPTERSLYGCEIRAALAGFRSDAVPLTNVHYLDNPDLGTLVLHRIAKVDGLTVSATLALAPKEARKAFEKGQEAVTKRNPDEAQKNFEKAVELYPRHAAAWYELGKIQEQRDHPDEARKSYEQSIVADPKYIPPHERLAVIALRESKWRELADHSEQVLKLDPIDYADVYYMDSVAQFQLNHYDLAEKQAREAIRLDSTKKIIRAYYILGLTQAQKHDFTASAQSLRTFLDGAGDQGTDFIRNQLAQVEQAAAEQAQPQSSPAPASQSQPTAPAPER